VNLKQHIYRKRVKVFCLNSMKEDLKESDVSLHVAIKMLTKMRYAQC